MKKEKILLACSLMFGLTGCAGNESPNNEDKEKTDFSSYPWGEFVEEGDFVSTTPTNEMGVYLDLFDEHIYANPDKETHEIEISSYDQSTGERFTESSEFLVGDITYYVYDPIAHGADPKGVYPVVYWFHGSGNALSGKTAVSASGAEYYASEEYQKKMGPCYIVCPLANETADENGNTLGNWITSEKGGQTSIYSTALKGLMDGFMTEHKDTAGKLVIAGTSAGGYCAWRYILDYTDTVDAALLMAPAYSPTEEDLKKIGDAGIKVLYIHALHDELVPYNDVTAPVIDTMKSMENVKPVIVDWARNGDKGIASLFFGVEMGQHCICVQVGENMMFADGTPMSEELPDGVTSWFTEIFK